MRRLLKWTTVALAAGGLASWAHAQDAGTKFPERPIRLIVAFSPGGATDVLARQLSDNLSKALGQAVVVENKPGASGYIAWRHVAGAPKDGYTLLFAENALGINTGLQTDRTFDPRTELDPIASVATSPLVIIEPGSLPPNAYKEYVEYSKKNNMSYSSSGIGSVSHMTFEALKDASGLVAEHVPFKGGGEAITAVVGGHVQGMLASVSTVKKLVDAKQVKALLITSDQRSPVLPDVPSIKELGINSQVQLQFWWGVFAPVGVPDAVKAKLNKAVSDVLADKAVHDRLVSLDVTPAYAPAADLKKMLNTEIENWTAFVKKTGIKIE
jgi:tripartite-type tricarboxylate transporter receptor subunit TctC